MVGVVTAGALQRRRPSTMLASTGRGRRGRTRAPVPHMMITAPAPGHATRSGGRPASAHVEHGGRLGADRLLDLVRARRARARRTAWSSASMASAAAPGRALAGDLAGIAGEHLRPAVQPAGPAWKQHHGAGLRPRIARAPPAASPRRPPAGSSLWRARSRHRASCANAEAAALRRRRAAAPSRAAPLAILERRQRSRRKSSMSPNRSPISGNSPRRAAMWMSATSMIVTLGRALGGRDPGRRRGRPASGARKCASRALLDTAARSVAVVSSHRGRCACSPVQPSLRRRRR